MVSVDVDENLCFFIMPRKVDGTQFLQLYQCAMTVGHFAKLTNPRRHPLHFSEKVVVITHLAGLVQSVPHMHRTLYL